MSGAKVMTNRVTADPDHVGGRLRQTDPSSGDKVSIQRPGSKTMRIDKPAGLPKARHGRSHRQRNAVRTRRAR